MCHGWGKNIIVPYISPGIQVGVNSSKGFFYGFQVSVGIIYEPNNSLYTPSLCFGYKKYKKSTNNEGFIDLQSVYSYYYDDFPKFGIGIGKNFSNGTSSIRIKGYLWLITSFTYDYEFKKKLHNYSLIPVFPISSIL